MSASRWVLGTTTTLLVCAVLVWVTYLALLPPPPLDVPEQGARFESVVLIVPGENRSSVVDIVVEHDKITRIAPAKTARVKGYILPGLVDAHMHGPMLPLPREEEVHAFLYLYHGVTLARMAAGDAAMRDAIRAGEYPGPQLLCCGPFVDGEPPLWPGSQVVTDASTASQAVTRIHAEGYDCVKVYNELTEVAAAAIHRTARELGIPVIGHVPWRTDFTAAHIDDVQHLVGLYHANPQIEADPGVHAMLQLASVDRERVDDIIAALPSTPKALTPTLITLQRKYALKDSTQLANSAQAQLLPNYYSSHLWHPSQGLVSARVLTTQDQHEFSALYPAVERSLMQLYLAGLPLHTGTDAPAEFIVPGAGLWEELQLLSAIGLGPETALKLSTVDTARYLRGGGEDRPQLSEGAPADFVVYSKDPTSDLRHLSSRTAVVTQGRVYTGEMLDQQLQRYQSWYENPAYRLTSNTLVKSGLALIGALQ